MLDGPDGSGKTTQFKLLVAHLKQQGHKVYATHMLGGTPVGEALRAVMFSDRKRPALTNMHISLAIYAALSEVVSKKRAAGYTVVIDRSPLSLVAYQVHGDGVDETVGYEACAHSLEMFQPDALIVYKAPAMALAIRRAQRDEDLDYFEKKQLDYHTRTAWGYANAAQHYHATIIDATQSIEDVEQQTQAVVAKIL